MKACPKCGRPMPPPVHAAIQGPLPPPAESPDQDGGEDERPEGLGVDAEIDDL